jgi:pimeloyl-ACP methyl ester carboxylesterase
LPLGGIKLLATVFGLGLGLGIGAGAAAAPPEVVVVLHGLMRSERAVRPLARRLGEAGYVVRAPRYPSTRARPDELVAALDEALDAGCRSAPRLHFVAHSMGGVLVRAYLAEHRLPNLGRVVMLGTPNHGSEIVDRLGGAAAFRWLVGPTAIALGTDGRSWPRRLPDPAYDVGIVAGSASLDPIGSRLIPGADDGRVSVASTKLASMADHLVVSRSHTFLLYDDEVARQVVHFLRNGRFRRTP